MAPKYGKYEDLQGVFCQVNLPIAGYGRAKLALKIPELQASQALEFLQNKACFLVWLQCIPGAAG
jgi:hypothetical protein